MTDPDSCRCSAPDRLWCGTVCDCAYAVAGGAVLHFCSFSPGDTLAVKMKIAECIIHN